MDTLTSKLFGEESWLTFTVIILGCILLGLALRWLLFLMLKLSQDWMPTVLKEQLLEHRKVSAKFLLPILFIYGSLQYFEVNTFWHKVVEALIIINIAWILIALMNALEEVVKEKFAVTVGIRQKIERS